MSQSNGIVLWIFLFSFLIFSSVHSHAQGPASDLNVDGVVDLQDAALIGQSWMTLNTDPDIRAMADLDLDNVVSLGDVGLFASEWLSGQPAMVSYWKFEEGGGTTAEDSLGSNDGALNGMDGTAWIPGKFGGVLHFDGIDDYVAVDRQITDDFTIAFWLRTTDTGAAGSQWYYGNGLVDAETEGIADDFGISLVEHKAAFGVGNPDTTLFSVSSVNDGIWHHVAATRDCESGGQMKLYVDGILEAWDYSPEGPKNASAQIRFGSLQTGLNFFAGDLDEIRIYHTVLDDEQILKLARGIVFYQKPYNGLIHTIPGILEAEHYDQGGEGSAYHDDGVKDGLAGFRPGDTVDVKGTADTGGGHVVGWIRDGEWLEYTANLAAGTTYDIELRAASPFDGGQVRMLWDDAEIGLLDIPNTGSLIAWDTVTLREVSMAAGMHKYLRLEMIETPSAPPTQSGGISLDNPGFEDGTLDPWVLVHGSGGNAGWSINSSTVQAGTYSALWNNDKWAEGYSFGSISQTVSVSPSQTFDVSYSYHADSSNYWQTLEVQWLDASDGVISTDSDQITPVTGTWTQHLMQVTSPANAVKAVLKVSIQQKTGTTKALFYYDRVAVVAEGAAGNPDPYHGQLDVPGSSALQWEYLKSTQVNVDHFTLYLDTDELKVANPQPGDPMLINGMQITPTATGNPNLFTGSHSYSSIQPDTWYYWRVDTTVSPTGGGAQTTYPGSVWKFHGPVSSFFELNWVRFEESNLFTSANSVFSLNKLVTTSTIVNAMVFPPGPFDPDGNWTNNYDLYLTHTNSDKGNLTIQRTAGTGTANLDVTTVYPTVSGYEQYTTMDMNVSTDGLFSQPQDWTYSRKLATDAGAAAYLYSGVNNAGQIVNGSLLRMTLPNETMDIAPVTGLFTGTTVGNDPQLLLKVNGSEDLNLNAADYTKLLIRGAVDAAVPPGTDFMIRFRKGGVWYAHSFPTGPGWQEYWVDLTQAANWSGTIEQFRLDFAETLPDDYTIEMDAVILKGPLHQHEWYLPGDSQITVSNMSYQIEHFYADKWSMFDAVQRLPREDFGMIPLNFIKDGDKQVGPQVLRFGREVTTEMAGHYVTLYSYERLGQGVMPCDYWVDENGRCLFVSTGMEQFIIK